MQSVPASRDVQTDRPTQFQITDEEADLAAEEENNRADTILAVNTANSASAASVTTDATQPGCPVDTCSWCGFDDHTRKTRRSCPQHEHYGGSKYAKGAKVSPEWLPGTRQSHARQRQRRRQTPLTVRSVRCASTDKDFTTTDWVEGTGALAGHQPKVCLANEATVPKACHGWTKDTPPIELFDWFYKVCIITHLMDHICVLFCDQHGDCSDIYCSSDAGPGDKSRVRSVV